MFSRLQWRRNADAVRAVIHSLGPIVYIDPPQVFDIVKLVKGNPLILVLLVGALMSVSLPSYWL